MADKSGKSIGRVVMDDRDSTLRDVERLIERRIAELTRLEGMRGESMRMRRIEAERILSEIRSML